MTFPTARFTASRAHVDIALLLQPEETEASQVFRQFLAAVDKTAGVTWLGNSLEGGLLADNESAHLYVAMHLPQYEKWCSDDPEEGVFSDPPHELLWNAYRLGCQQGVK